MIEFSDSHRTYAVAETFASGVTAAFVAFLFRSALIPDSPQLTSDEVNSSLAQTPASVIPLPSFSACVFQAIFPSLVFFEIEATGLELIEQ